MDVDGRREPRLRAAQPTLTPAGIRLVTEALPTAQRLAAELLEPHVRKPELAKVAALMANLG